MEGFTSQEDQELLSRIEKQLKRRFAIGSQVSEHSIIQDFTKQVGLPWGLAAGPGVLLLAPVACFPPARQLWPVAQQTGLGRGRGSCSLSWTCSCHLCPRECFSLGRGRFSVPLGERMGGGLVFW